MNYIKGVEDFINRLGWFPGSHKILNVFIETEFELYGRASETWESRVVLETKEIRNDVGKTIFPDIKIVGKKGQTLEDLFRELYYKLITLGYLK